MTSSNPTRRISPLLGAILLAGLVLLAREASAPYLALAETDGQVSAAPPLPKDFRRTMVHLGSWFVPDGGAAGFHDVYASPEAVDHYRNTGRWQDGATLVKELRKSASGDYTTGAGVKHAVRGEVIQTFVMVKDADRSEKGPLWGDGWGWALYKPDQPGVNVASNYKTDCFGCHIPAKKHDYIYVEAYPTLDR